MASYSLDVDHGIYRNRRDFIAGLGAGGDRVSMGRWPKERYSGHHARGDLVLEIESLPRNLCDVHHFQSWGYCCGLSDGSGGWDTRVATRVAVLRVSPARR